MLHPVTPRAGLPVGLLVVAALALGCQFGRTVDGGGGCKRDGDCANFEFCEIDTGLCLCADDNACDANEFCNDQGRCQTRSGCVANDDCNTGDGTRSICDTTTGECVELTPALQCTLSSHCGYGSFCDGNACVPGCQSNGDCALGEPCIDGQCDPAADACNQNGYCEFGQYCDLDSNRCLDHAERASLCATCDPRQVGACPNGGPCLIDSSVPPNPCTADADCAELDAICLPRGQEGIECTQDPSVCGPGGTCGQFTGQCACALGESCPAGTVCNGLICVPGQCGRNFCGTNACDEVTDPCPRGYQCFTLITVTGASCTLGDNTCQGGRVCQVGGENEVAGFCSCIEDGDCPLGTVCENPGPNGACVSGSTCGPQPGLLCEDLQ